MDRLLECVGGPLDGKKIKERGPRLALSPGFEVCGAIVKEGEHKYQLALYGDGGERREVYLYEYPEGNGW